MGSQFPLKSATPRFTVGRDHHGWWVVEDKLDRVGGLFASEAAALHFAQEESNRDPSAVCRAPMGKFIEFKRIAPPRQATRR
ncbi:hypothetical protein [Pararhizobium arenae]|uniref:hypothetical protein n=1 Tax=Pararhizobium arenae TaxID=1856850 RepID=UPI00094B3D45|nr:hypothetical protein [Pararhizobium arenae]